MRRNDDWLDGINDRDARQLPDAVGREIGFGENRHYSGDRARRLQVQPGDTRERVGRANHMGVQHARHDDIIDIATVAGDEAAILEARNSGADEAPCRDSGLLYFVVGDDGAQGGVWPQSIECQIQENDVGDVYAIRTIASTTIDPATASAKQPTFKDQAGGDLPYTTPGGANDRIVRSQMLEHDGWNSVEVLLQGDGAVHVVNGVVNMRITHAFRPDPADAIKRVPLRRGRILLQAEGAEVWFRNIEVRPLGRSG